MRSSLVLSGLLALVVACGGASTSKVTTVPAEPAAAPDDDCPMTVPGTSVAVEDTPTGAALVFATTGDVAALRARVGAWAEAHNAHHAAMGPLPTGQEAAGGGGHDHDHHGAHGGGGGDDEGGGGHEGHGGGAAGEGGGPMAIGIHSRAAAVDIDAGARLELTAFPDQIGAMRDELRAHAQHLASGHCAMPPGA